MNSFICQMKVIMQINLKLSLDHVAHVNALPALI